VGNLAGIAATDAVWEEFDHKWQKMLSSRYPVAPFIHMIDILNDEDPFEPEVGWDYDKKHSLVQDAIVLLSHMSKTDFRMFWCSINESARLRLQKEGKVVPDSPWVHCAAACVWASVGAYTLNVSDAEQEPWFLFFDRGERFLSKFRQNYFRYRTKQGCPKDPENWWDSFVDVQEVDSAYHSGLQAADMVAWGHTRTLSQKERPFSWLKEWLVKVVPSTSLEYTEEVLRRSEKDPALRRGFERVFR
jgi:hypothetical protein